MDKPLTTQKWMITAMNTLPDIYNHLESQCANHKLPNQEHSHKSLLSNFITNLLFLINALRQQMVFGFTFQSDLVVPTIEQYYKVSTVSIGVQFITSALFVVSNIISDQLNQEWKIYLPLIEKASYIVRTLIDIRDFNEMKRVNAMSITILSDTHKTGQIFNAEVSEIEKAKQILRQSVKQELEVYKKIVDELELKNITKNNDVIVYHLKAIVANLYYP